MTWLTALALGFLLGMRHATDADHVVAVATIVARERRILAALRVGTLWGIGHTTTILLVGGAIVLFGLVIPPELGLSLELSVAVMLVLLGGLNLLWALRDPAADANSKQDVPTVPMPGRRLQPLLVGSVHGLAGSAAIALLVLTTLRDTTFALVYLAVFGLGSVLGMALLTSAMAAPLAFASRRFASFTRRLSGISGAVSIAFGLFLIYQIGFVDGLFNALAYGSR
ncbi:MAG TPA: high-affinity nickel-transport family protein [Polyangiaceae bacterium]|nr:high-affinity nickel-transport family protein [Polyangiaceae bacterium]